METIRPATATDLGGVAAIYADAVRTSVATFDLEPLPLSSWEERLASTARGDHLLVATEDERVLGYAYSSSYRPRPAYDRTREASVYLDATAGGRGIGRRLYDELLALMAADGVHTVVALIALPNDQSEALHRACGFRHVGTMTEVGHKFGRWIDTAWYERRLP
jgi:L-amino acid N-acyltransferase YncA